MSQQEEASNAVGYGGRSFRGWGLCETFWHIRGVLGFRINEIFGQLFAFIRDVLESLASLSHYSSQESKR